MNYNHLRFDYCVSIDDHEEDRMRVKDALESFADDEFSYDYFLDFNGLAGFNNFKKSDDFYPSDYSLVMLDVDFGDGKERLGLALLKRFEQEHPKWPIILTTNFDSIDIYKAAKSCKNFAGYIVKSGISRNTIMNQLESWLEHQETEYLKYVEETCNELLIKIKEYENRQTSPNDSPRVIFNNFNIRLYKDNLIEKADLSSSEAWDMAKKITAYVEHGKSLKLNYFPSNMDGAFKVLEGRIGSAKRFYFKPKNNIAIVFEISGEANKVINQNAFRNELFSNSAKYQDYFKRF